jgi:hypothetical protein
MPNHFSRKREFTKRFRYYTSEVINTIMYHPPTQLSLNAREDKRFEFGRAENLRPKFDRQNFCATCNAK